MRMKANETKRMSQIFNLTTNFNRTTERFDFRLKCGFRLNWQQRQQDSSWIQNKVQRENEREQLEHLQLKNGRTLPTASG